VYGVLAAERRNDLFRGIDHESEIRSIRTGRNSIFSCINLPAHVKLPQDYLGFRVGEDYKLADWQQITGYFSELRKSRAPGSSSMHAGRDSGGTAIGRTRSFFTTVTKFGFKTAKEMRS
jgi:hypothetical protein